MNQLGKMLIFHCPDCGHVNIRDLHESGSCESCGYGFATLQPQVEDVDVFLHQQADKLCSRIDAIAKAEFWRGVRNGFVFGTAIWITLRTAAFIITGR